MGSIRNSSISNNISRPSLLARHAYPQQTDSGRKLIAAIKPQNPKIKSRMKKKTISPIVTPYENAATSTLYSPFTTKAFSSGLIRAPKRKSVPYEGVYKLLGLSPKEKMYIIGNCQKKPFRYAQLKKIATDAIENNKIFAVHGSCKTVRKALIERGWVEKLPIRRMNLNKINSGRLTKNEVRAELEDLLLSHLVEKCSPNFIWRTKEHQQENIIDMTIDHVPTVNKLRVGAAWTTKQGLCSAMKRNYWFYIEDVAEVYSPRTYDSSEVDSFNNDFKMTACTSLLKWVLSMVANGRPVFVSTGTVSINVILFALSRCKEYLYRKQNRDIDKPLTNLSSGQWNYFMKNYHRIISKTDTFEVNESKLLYLYLSYAKLLLKEIHKYRPQLSCEGCHNIWIIKPVHCCRGRGIRMASRLGDLNDILNGAKAKYVVQKYIEEPLLIHETKFDIRQYYLITSTCPVVIWMYTDCYLKFSSQKYNLKNYHESIHLTNNAVQRKYKNCENRSGDLPLSNMWELDEYKSYLKKIGKGDVWANIVYPGMRKAIISIVLGCQDSLAECRNRFELYGCDFLLDKNYRPWLIEINSCPDLNHTTPVTARICPAVITDLIKVVIDYANDQSSPTGKFECIYRQPFTVPRYSSLSGGDLSVRGHTLPPSYFYKGKLEPKDSFHGVSSHLDIAAMMKMVKTNYDEDTKLEPDKISEYANAILNSELDQCSQSKDLNPSASCVGLRLADLCDKVVLGINALTNDEPNNPKLT